MPMTVADLLKQYLKQYFQTYPAGYKGIQLFKQGIKNVLENNVVTIQLNEKSVLGGLQTRSEHIFTSNLDYTRNNALSVPPQLSNFVKPADLPTYAAGFGRQDDIKTNELQNRITEFAEMYAQGLPKDIISQNNFFKWNVLASCFLYSNIQDLKKLGYIKAEEKLTPVLNAHIKVTIKIIKNIDRYTAGTWKAINIAVLLRPSKLDFPKPDVLQDRHSELLRLDGYAGANPSFSPVGGLKNEQQININASNSYNNQQNSIQYNQGQYSNNNQIQTNANRNAAQSPYTQSNQQAGYGSGQYGREAVSLHQARQYSFQNQQNTQAGGNNNPVYSYPQTQQYNQYNTAYAGYSNNQTGNQQLAITYDNTNTTNQFSNQNTQDESVSVPDGFSASDLPYLNRAVKIAADQYGIQHLDDIIENINTGGGVRTQNDFSRYIFTLTKNGKNSLIAAISDTFAGSPIQSRSAALVDVLPDYIKKLSKKQLVSCFSPELRQKIDSQHDAGPELVPISNETYNFYIQYSQIRNGLLPDLLVQCIESMTARAARSHLDNSDASWFRKRFLSFLHSAHPRPIAGFYSQITGHSAPDQNTLDQFWQFVLNSAANMTDNWYLQNARPATLSENRVHKNNKKKSSPQTPRDYQLEQSFGEFGDETAQNINITAAASRATDNYGNQQAYGGFDGPAAVPPPVVHQRQNVQFDLPNSTADNYNNLNHTQNRTDAIQSQNSQFGLPHSAAYNNLNHTHDRNNGVLGNTYGSAGGPAVNDESSQRMNYQNNTIPKTAAMPGQMTDRPDFTVMNTDHGQPYPAVSGSNTQIKQPQYADSSVQTQEEQADTENLHLPKGFGDTKGNETTPARPKGKYQQLLENLADQISRTYHIDLSSGITAAVFINILQSLKN